MRGPTCIFWAELTPHLARSSLAAAAKVIYAGASAGGLTAYLHCDAVAGVLSHGP